MKKLISIFAITAASLACSMAFAANNSAVGYWKTIGDKIHKPRSIIHITQKHGIYQGRIVKTFLQPGESYSDKCTECSGKLKNQRILGMTIMTNMIQTANGKYGQGHIVDPKNGNSYHCMMTVKDHGKKLDVRGYIGISLFGRTQTWIRVNKPRRGRGTVRG